MFSHRSRENGQLDTPMKINAVAIIAAITITLFIIIYLLSL